MKLTVDRKIADPLYIYYYVASPASIEKIIRDSESTGVPKTNVAYLRSFPVLLPPLPEQKAIASILSSLDDKIELNRRMNETLEAMARAIFKDWFVDFGPTRAKQEGRAAYLPEHLWSLFPEAIDPETGLPIGWEESKLEDFMELAYGKSLTAKNRLPGDVVVYGSGGETGFHNEALISSPAVIVGRKGTVGSVYWEDRPVFPIDTVFYVIPKRTSLFFCYQLLINQPLPNMNTDAAVPGLNRNNVYRLEFPYPGSQLVNAYELPIDPVWKKRDTAFFILVRHSNSNERTNS
jgi:type I restriction enzyme S subunit